MNFVVRRGLKDGPALTAGLFGRSSSCRASILTSVRTFGKAAAASDGAAATKPKTNASSQMSDRMDVVGEELAKSLSRNLHISGSSDTDATKRQKIDAGHGSSAVTDNQKVGGSTTALGPFALAVVKTKERPDGREFGPLDRIPKGFGARGSGRKVKVQIGDEVVEEAYKPERDWWKFYTSPTGDGSLDRNEWMENPVGTKLAKELLSLNPVDLPPLGEAQQKLVEDLAKVYPPANAKMGPEEGHGVQFIDTSLSLIETNARGLIARPAVTYMIRQILNAKNSKVLVTGNEGIGKSRMIELVLRELLIKGKLVFLQAESMVYAFVPPIAGFGQTEYKVYSVELAEFRSCAGLRYRGAYRLIDPKKPENVPYHEVAVDMLFPSNDSEKWFKEFQKTDCFVTYLCCYSLTELLAVRSVMDPNTPSIVSDEELVRRYLVIGGIIRFAYTNNLVTLNIREGLIASKFTNLTAEHLRRIDAYRGVTNVDSNDSSPFPGSLVALFGSFQSDGLEITSGWASYNLSCWYPYALTTANSSTYVDKFSDMTERFFTPYLVRKGFQVQYFQEQKDAGNETYSQAEFGPFGMKSVEDKDISETIAFMKSLPFLREGPKYCYQPAQSNFPVIDYILARDAGIQTTIARSHEINVANMVKMLATLNDLVISDENTMEHIARKLIESDSTKKFTVILFLVPEVFGSVGPQTFSWGGLLQGNDGKPDLKARKRFTELVIQGKSKLVYPQPKRLSVPRFS